MDADTKFRYLNDRAIRFGHKDHYLTMPIRHHPSPQLRADYVAADIAPGAALVISLHLELCGACAVQVHALTGMAVDAGAPPLGIESRGGAEVPDLLKGRSLGRWRWISPGVRGAEVESVSGLGEAVWLLEVAAGATLPRRAAAAVGLLLVIDGALDVSSDQLGVGDLLEVTDPGLRMRALQDEGGVILVTTDANWPVFGLRRLAGLR